MPKKVMDIKAPEKKKEPVAEKKVEKTQKVVSYKQNKRRVPISVWLAGIVVVALVAVFLWLTLNSSLALTLTIKQEKQTFDQEVMVLVELSPVEENEAEIPGKIFNGVAEHERTFIATGKDIKGVKTEGTILVYNNHEPVKLISLRDTTRFLSANGEKIFRTPKTVFLPAATIENGKVVPSITEVTVVADEPGGDYNIGSSNFSVPGLAGTDLYYTVWAKSELAFSGGSKTEVSKVSEADLEKAEESLNQSLVKLAGQDITSKLPNGFIYNPLAFSEDSFEYTCSEKEGTVVDNFKCQGKVEIKGFALLKSSLDLLLLASIKDTLPLTKEVQNNTLDYTFIPKSILIEDEKMVIEVTGNIDIFEPIDEEILISRIAGQSTQEVENVLSNQYPQIQSTEFKFSPFWVRTVPKSSEKIELNLLP